MLSEFFYENFNLKIVSIELEGGGGGAEGERREPEARTAPL